MDYGEHGVERRERERQERLHTPFALHAPTQCAIIGECDSEEEVQPEQELQALFNALRTNVDAQVCGPN